MSVRGSGLLPRSFSSAFPPGQTSAASPLLSAVLQLHHPKCKEKEGCPVEYGNKQREHGNHFEMQPDLECDLSVLFLIG